MKATAVLKIFEKICIILFIIAQVLISLFAIGISDNLGIPAIITILLAGIPLVGNWLYFNAKNITNKTKRIIIKIIGIVIASSFVLVTLYELFF